MRQSFSGVYGFSLHGLLRAPTYQDGTYLGGQNPVLQQPIVIAGFFPEAVVAPAPVAVNAGYFPYALAGFIEYRADGTLQGRHRFSIGGNNDGRLHDFDGTYQLDVNTGFDGTYLVHDKVVDETVTVYFVLTDNDNEIHFMPIDGALGHRRVGRSISAIGVQKKIDSAQISR